MGDYVSVETVTSTGSVTVSDIFAYQRTSNGSDTFLIVLNFGDDTHALDLSHVAPQATITIATNMVRTGTVTLQNLIIHPNEGLVLRL
jgi:hypothetical protein